MEELYEITYGKIDTPLYISLAAIGKLSVGQTFKIPNMYNLKNLKPSEVSFKVTQISEPQVVNNRSVIKIIVDVIKNKTEENKPPTCYVCGIDLTESYKTDMKKQDGLNAPPIILKMIKWNGVQEIVCSDCYKAVESGAKVYMEKNPSWKRPVAKT